MRALSASRVDVVFAALGERQTEELAWWAEVIRSARGAPRLVALAERPSMGLVLQAEKLGVLDVASLPLRRDVVVRVFERLRAASTEVPLQLPPAGEDVGGRYALIGQHPSMLEVYKLIARVAKSNATVLIEGESGTGKECVAREIHASSLRASKPFVAVNCAAIPENLLESVLFGHEKGAFTGAVTRKLGTFEHAMGGTLFLDELADMSLALQGKILRAVQEREIERVGGGEVIPVNVRLIGATNKDLREAIAHGRFREDLYYRLAVVTTRLPRLADRGDDLWLLTAYFVREFSERYGKRIETVSDHVRALLYRHDWAGHVRELRNVIERAVIVATDGTLRTEHLPDELRREEMALPEPRGEALGTLVAAEGRHIAGVLRHTSGQIGAAARILGIHRNTLARKMKEYGL